MGGQVVISETLYRDLADRLIVDYDEILKKIITGAMELTNCEGGTLYLYRNDSLEFMIMRNVDPDVERRGREYMTKSSATVRSPCWYFHW